MTEKELISQLTPNMQKKVVCFFNKARANGFSPRITSGYRTIAQQNALYAIGRTKPGKIITNAKGSQSNHTKRIAVDIVDKKLGYNLNWSLLSKLGKACGLNWGGDWKFVDKPHFEDNGKTFDTPAPKENTDDMPTPKDVDDYSKAFRKKPATSAEKANYSKRSWRYLIDNFFRSYKGGVAKVIAAKNKVISDQKKAIDKLVAENSKPGREAIVADIKPEAPVEKPSLLKRLLSAIFGG